MPDLANFSIVRAGNVNLTVPTWSISGKITNRPGGLPDIDFTGANAVSFPQVLGQLTAGQQDEIVVFVVNLVLQRKFPAVF